MHNTYAADAFNNNGNNNNNNTIINNNSNNNNNTNGNQMMNETNNNSNANNDNVSTNPNSNNSNNGNMSNQQYNAINNNALSPLQPGTNLSLNTMMASRDNRRVSFHDEESNVNSSISSGEQAELSIVREDPNVRLYKLIFFVVKKLFRLSHISITMYYVKYLRSAEIHSRNIGVAADTNDSRRRIMEYSRSTDARRYRSSGSLQVHSSSMIPPENTAFSNTI